MMNQPQQPQFTIAELGARFGPPLAQAFSEIIVLEKAVQSFQSQIQAMTENVSALVDHIQDLEGELDALKSENMEREAQMKEQSGLSPEMVEIVAEAKSIINETYNDAEASAGLAAINA